MSKPDHGVKRKRSRASKSSSSFLTGRPSPMFIRWTRRILVVWWIVLVMLQAPDFVRRFNDIQRTVAPGFDRSAALQRLIGDAGGQLVALPGLLFAMLGYGI